MLSRYTSIRYQSPRRALLLLLALLMAAILLTRQLGPAGASAGPLAGAANGTASCPSSHRHLVTSGRPGASAALVPPTPTSVLLCRYDGLAEPALGITRAFDLIAHRSVADPTTVAKLVSELNALRAPLRGPVACPNDDGSAIVGYFRYAAGSDDPVTVALTGCATAANGHLTRSAVPSPVLGRLTALVPAPALGTIKGHLEFCGGPAPGGCRVQAFSLCGATTQSCITAHRVAIVGASGRRVAVLKLNHARFRIKVQAGRYTLKLLGDGRHVHGKVMQTAHARVRSGRSTSVVFRIAVP